MILTYYANVKYYFILERERLEKKHLLAYQYQYAVLGLAIAIENLEEIQKKIS